MSYSWPTVNPKLVVAVASHWATLLPLVHAATPVKGPNPTAMVVVAENGTCPAMPWDWTFWVYTGFVITTGTKYMLGATVFVTRTKLITVGSGTFAAEYQV